MLIKMTLNLNGEQLNEELFVSSSFVVVAFACCFRPCDDIKKYKKILNISDSESVCSSSEDLKIKEKSICCCVIDSRNPTIKRDRQLQLFKVNI